jgi:hypothetical protein
MTIRELRDKLIEEGIASIRKHEKRPERIQGGITGFELCRSLETPKQFQTLLDQRHRMEQHMRDEGVSSKIYWEYRYATAQVEYVWERLKVAWGIGPAHSARAVLHVGAILQSANEEC